MTAKLIIRLCYKGIMNEVITTVRLPRKLREEITQVVQQGHFKNVSDLLVASARNEVEKYAPSRATLLARQARKEIWNEYLAKAKGSTRKAIKLMHEDDLKYEKENKAFFKY